MPSQVGSGAASGAAAGASFGPWGALIGGIVGAAGGLANKQKAPKTVPYTPVNLQDEQMQAITGNLAAQGSIENLLTRANRYTQNQANSLMELAVPGYAKLSEKFLSLAGDNLADPYGLPKDVSDNLARIAAERGIQTGVRGEAREFSGLRDLGVNMLDYGNQRVNQAQNLLSTIVGLSPRVSPMSPLSFYVTPAQQAAVTTNNNTMKQASEQGGANAAAAASNWNSANLWDSLAQSSALIGSAVDQFSQKKTPPKS